MATPARSRSAHDRTSRRDQHEIALAIIGGLFVLEAVS